MSVGEIEPSPEDGLHAKYSVQYGFNDVMDSLPEESRAEVRKDFDDMSNVEGMWNTSAKLFNFLILPARRYRAKLAASTQTD